MKNLCRDRPTFHYAKEILLQMRWMWLPNEKTRKDKGKATIKDTKDSHMYAIISESAV